MIRIRLLEDVPLAMWQTMWFLHVELCSFYHDVKQFLDFHYSDWWIGQNGPVLWFPQSPDQTLAEFYLWGQLKGRVYLKRVNMRDKLWCLIQVAVSTIQCMPGIFQHTRSSWCHRALLCIRTMLMVHSPVGEVIISLKNKNRRPLRANAVDCKVLCGDCQLFLPNINCKLMPHYYTLSYLLTKQLRPYVYRSFLVWFWENTILILLYVITKHPV
jgi:hypothetical protein